MPSRRAKSIYERLFFVCDGGSGHGTYQGQVSERVIDMLHEKEATGVFLVFFALFALLFAHGGGNQFIVLMIIQSKHGIRCRLRAGPIGDLLSAFDFN